jgi:very-short-patch-repair endonuclease
MPIKKIITGQHISQEQFERSKELRRKMTPAEKKLWQRLRAGRLEDFHFRRQQVVHRFIVDFYCHQANLVVEVDGGVHLEQTEYDRERDSYLKARGLCVLRFTNQQVNQNLEGVLTEILGACQRIEHGGDADG